MASSSIYKGSDGVFLHDCDVCLSQSTISEAVSYCSICCEHLCQPCDKAHRGSRATKDHGLLTGSQIPSRSLRKTPTSSIMYCDVHKTTILNLYCKVHGEALCSTCRMTKHPRCDTVEVNRYIAQINVAEKCSKVEASLDDLTSRISDFKKSRQTERSAVKTHIQKCLHDMQELRKTIDDRMDELEQTLSSQLRDIEQTIGKEMKSNMATIDDIMQQTQYQKSLLNQYKNVQNDDVTFVALNKTSSREKEYRNILDELQKQVYDRDIRFQPDDVITDVLLQLTSLGTVVVDKQSKYPSPVPTSVLNMSVVDKQEIDVGSCSVQGCTFMSDGHLVLACRDDGLKLFDEDFQFISQLGLPGHSIDVSAINDTDILVAMGELNQLNRVRVLPDMKVVRTLNMDKLCNGVDVNRDEIYVTCYDKPGNGEVVVLNMDGQVLRRLGVDNGKYMFTTPRRVKVSCDGSKMFISDEDTHTVTCLNQRGHVVYQYSDRHLGSPVGMFVDSDNNILVCGLKNVHMVRQDGRKKKILLTQKDGLDNPVSIAYRQSDGCLAFGLHIDAKTDKKLIVFKTK